MLPHDAPSSSTRAARGKSVLRLIDALEDHDDVQNVYANFDIPDAVLEAVAAAEVGGRRCLAPHAVSRHRSRHERAFGSVRATTVQ